MFRKQISNRLPNRYFPKVYVGCSCQNNWKLISHANISSKGLNKGGLHLNREGYELLQNNFVNFMRSNCSMNVDYPLVSQMLPELVDNDVHSGSLGPSSMPNFYQLNVVSKWPLWTLTVSSNILTNLESVSCWVFIWYSGNWWNQTWRIHKKFRTPNTRLWIYPSWQK